MDKLLVIISSIILIDAKKDFELQPPKARKDLIQPAFFVPSPFLFILISMTLLLSFSIRESKTIKIPIIAKGTTSPPKSQISIIFI